MTACPGPGPDGGRSRRTAWTAARYDRRAAGTMARRERRTARGMARRRETRGGQPEGGVTRGRTIGGWTSSSAPVSAAPLMHSDDDQATEDGCPSATTAPTLKQ